MKLRVCILSTVHPSFDIRIFHKQAKTLARAGYDVILIAQHDGDQEVEGIRIKGLRHSRNRLGRMTGLTCTAFWLALRARADVYHFHDPELLPIGVMLKLTTRAKLIYDVHEDVPRQILTKQWIPWLLRRPASFMSRVLEGLMARCLDAVVPATESIAAEPRFVQPTVVHNYPDLRMLPKVASAGNEGEEYLLTYVGGIGRLRGAIEMIRATDLLNLTTRCCLELIGSYESHGLEQEMRASPGFKWVRSLGPLPWAEAWMRAQSARVGLVIFHPAPNHDRSMPNKLFEYMAAGLPVVASDFPLWKEIVEGNNCGLCVDPLNPKAIADAAQYFLAHPEEASRMGANGRRAVEEKYNWETEAKRLLHLYESLLRTT